MAVSIIAAEESAMELDPLSCVRDFDDAAENLPLCGGALPRRIRWEAATAAEAIRPFAPSARGHAQVGPRWRPPPCYLSLRSIHTIPGILRILSNGSFLYRSSSCFWMQVLQICPLVFEDFQPAFLASSTVALALHPGSRQVTISVPCPAC